MSTGQRGPRLAVLFAFVEPEETLDFARPAPRMLAATGGPGTSPVGTAGDVGEMTGQLHDQKSDSYLKG
jgi:hypothetical protein